MLFEELEGEGHVSPSWMRSDFDHYTCPPSLRTYLDQISSYLTYGYGHAIRSHHLFVWINDVIRYHEDILVL